MIAIVIIMATGGASFGPSRGPAICAAVSAAKTSDQMISTYPGGSRFAWYC